MTTRIILADDHVMTREGLSRALEEQEGLDVVAQADDGLATVRLTRRLQPDLVIMDIGMPNLNGIEATRHIHQDCPSVKVLALTMHVMGHYIREMFRAGATGYLLKNCAFRELLEAIAALQAGQSYISPAISHCVLEDYVAPRPEDVRSIFSLLSPRERQVTQLLTEGLTTKETTRRLHISPKTVEVHRSHILQKLQLDSIAELTKVAILEGLTSAEPHLWRHATAAFD